MVVVVKFGHKIFVLFALFSLFHAVTSNEQNCTWKYYCLDMNEQRQCIEMSQPEINCGNLADQIIDVATRCPPGQAHDFRGKCRKIFV